MDLAIIQNVCQMYQDVISSWEIRSLVPSRSHPTTLQYSSYVLSIVTCIIGLPANLLVIFVTGFLMQKNKYKIWFLNLALADFTFLLFLLLHAVYVIRDEWPYGLSVCKLYHFLTFVNMYAGIYILTALNIDRVLSVAKPIWHRRFYSRRFCWCMCTAIWVIAALCSIPAIVYSDVHGRNICILSDSEYTLIGHSVKHFVKTLAESNWTIDEFIADFCINLTVSDSESEMYSGWREIVVTTVHLVVPLVVVGYVIPLCVILVSNIIIALHVKNSKMAASSRLYRVVMVAVMSFFCSKTPYVVTFITLLVSLYTMKFTLVYTISLILPLLFSFAATNSLLNPVVYVLVGKEVRSEIVHFFRRKYIQYVAE